MLTIRSERAGDVAAIRRTHELAFEQTLEADLVDALRGSGCDSLSLVADDDGIVGHILFTPVEVKGALRTGHGMGLAPVSVTPGRQRQGIGSRLVEQGLDSLRQRACPFVVVLGHPDYYPRFGFERASAYGLTCAWKDVPDDAFMVAVLDRHAMMDVEGVVLYREEFGLVTGGAA